MTTTMRALVGGLGADWELQEQDIAPMQLGAVRVRIIAAALNRADLYMLEGSYRLGGKVSDVFTAGMEVAGIVETSSPMAPHLPVGTRVMGVTKGAFADYAICHPGILAPIPENLSFTDAAALPVGLMTEFDALTQAGFTAGQSVLIAGGTTAIGLIGIQVAKALGASKVIATTNSEDKRQAILAAGADVAINVAAEDLVETVLAATDGQGVDVTLDHVGGTPFGQLPGATKVGGVIVNIGRLAGKETTLDLDQLSFRRQKFIGTTFSIRTQDELAAVFASIQPVLTDAVGQGQIKPVIDGIYGFEDHLEAATRLRSGKTIGKLVLHVADPETVDLRPAKVANFFGTIRQLGYVVRDLDAAIDHWVSLGVGPWFRMNAVQPDDFTYQGEPSAMAMDVAVANSGDIQIELIQQINDAPSMYVDFLNAGHEGLQHVAYWTTDFQGLYDKSLAAGFTVGQEGAIGGPEGRFCYFNGGEQPGTVVEISDLGGAKAIVFEFVKTAAANWDGSQPVIVIDPAMLKGAQGA